jgi:hypothetical protein
MNAVNWPRTIPYIYSDPRVIHCCTWRSPRYFLLSASQYRIYFSHIQLAMKQHYCGTDIGFPLDAFQHLEVIHHKTKQRTTLSSVDAQIVSNELLIRAQTWILLPWDRRDEFIEELAKDCSLFDICVHRRRRPLDLSLLSDLVRSSLGQLQAQGNCHTQTLQCPSCCMDLDLFGNVDLLIYVLA